MSSRTVLPLPRFVLHPLTSAGLGAVHVYLAAGHLGELAAGNVLWVHVWKGFGALAGAYIFAALASRGFARRDHPMARELAPSNLEAVRGEAAK